jgi:Fe-S-cluster containining protein
MGREEAYRELEEVYADLERELSALRPKCELSGRCCRFKEFDHQLWTTGLELDYLLERHALPESIPDGACPYQADGLCGVRDRRMLGCRIFFCDPAYKAAMGPLYEKYHARIKAIHLRHEIAYRYDEVLKTLREADRGHP